MAGIIVNTTFRDFTGGINDEMQISFLRSLKKQTMQDFILVVTIFNEMNVEKIVRSMLNEKCVFIHDEGGLNYKFSLSKTFMNGVDYGLKSNACILLDCSSDVILQKNFLKTMVHRCGSNEAGISHPNVFIKSLGAGKKELCFGKISRGIDARYFSMDLFRNESVYELLNQYPSYDYGAGIEIMLGALAIKYASNKHNIFMESKVFKMENDRDGETGAMTDFMREGFARNIPIVKRFFRREKISDKYLNLVDINMEFKLTRQRLKYYFLFLGEYIDRFKEKISW